MKNTYNNMVLYVLIYSLFLVLLGCDHQDKFGKIILTEDLDVKEEGKYVYSRWQNKSHVKISFNENNGGEVEYDCPHLRTMKGLYQHKHFNIPVIYKACREPIENFRSPVVIWLHGGPFTYASAENITAKSMFLKNGFTIVEPLYRGSHDRPWNFISSLGDLSSFLNTRREIIELLNFYKRNGRGIILAGDSFGGFIISSILLELGKSDKILLLQSALTSNTIKKQAYGQKNILQYSDIPIYNNWCKISKYKICNNHNKWYFQNIFESYSNFSPVVNYRKQKLSSQIYIISGEKDEVVGVDEAKAFAAAFPDSVHHLIVPDLGHDDISNIRQFNQIEKFLAPVFALSKTKDNDK
jgi:pimeloyl-ACP methyl ester carboxylesterase